MKVLVDYPYPTSSSTRKAVSIGGGSVSLPSSFTLAISPVTPKAGEDLTITATAQTIAGVPQPNVTVTVVISSGPDAGQTLTAITNSSGIATITIRTNSTGTAVYTATATVSGITKTVSATVTWDPPATTVAPEATTTLPSTTTVVPSTTIETVVPIVTESPLKNVSVLDAPEEQHLPKTGLSTIAVLLISFQLLLIGFAMVKGQQKIK